MKLLQSLALPLGYHAEIKPMIRIKGTLQCKTFFEAKTTSAILFCARLFCLAKYIALHMRQVFCSVNFTIEI